MKTTTGLEYELRDLTLKEREHCGNAKTTMNNISYDLIDGKMKMLGNITVDKPKTALFDWVRAGLDSLDGEKITIENKEESINSLSDVEIQEISNIIVERTNGGTKKKS